MILERDSRGIESLSFRAHDERENWCINQRAKTRHGHLCGRVRCADGRWVPGTDEIVPDEITVPQVASSCGHFVQQSHGGHAQARVVVVPGARAVRDCEAPFPPRRSQPWNVMPSGMGRMQMIACGTSRNLVRMQPALLRKVSPPAVESLHLHCPFTSHTCSSSQACC